MSLSNVIFKKGQGGLSRTLPGEDYISGIIFYDNTKPTGFSTKTIQKVLSITDAENLGIKNDYSDETASKGTLTVNTGGTAGDSYDIAVIDVVNDTIIDLGIYTSIGSLTTDNEAIAITNFINSNTYSHKFTATTSGSTVTVISPAGYGLAANTFTNTKWGSTLAITAVNFSGGIASKLAQYHYQISEYFRLQPNGVLYISIANVPTTYFATEILDIQTEALGKIRQLAIFANAKTSILKADEDSIQTAVDYLESIFGVGLSVLYTTDLIGVTNLTSLLDQSSFLDNKVSTVISQSFSGQGYKLWKQSGKSVPTLGACLGTVALSKVSQDIAWVGGFNISDGTECEIIGFSNGKLSTQISNQLQEQLHGYRYIFLRKFIGVTGSFWNDSNCSISTSSDYCQIENNRTIDKSIRSIRTSLIPELNSPIDLNSDGTLSDVTIVHFTGLCKDTLELMLRNAELSAYNVVIPKSQNILSTNTLYITINIVPRGVARQIQVTIGFTTSIK